MATDAIIILETLRCITLRNTESRTEPYIWPVLIRVDDNTLATSQLVSLTAPVLGNARVVIKDSMRAGETADIPSSVGILRTRFDDGLTMRRLILVVALWEEDETPQDAMEAGFQAFKSSLQDAIGDVDNLFPLSTANEEEREQIIKEIRASVTSRVESAIRNELSAWEKAKVLAGVLNLDDPIDSNFLSFGENGLDSAPITMAFEAKRRILGIDTLSQYEIQGQLQVRPVVVDRCQAKVAAVNAAQAVVNDIEAEISALQAQLQGQGEEPPLPKSFIIAEIKRLREEELKPAMEALKQARAALQACRDWIPPSFSFPCQAEVNAIKAAQSAVDSVHAQRQALQAALQHASPAEKPFIISEIKRLSKEEIVLIAALEDARRAFQACLDRIPVFDSGSVLTQATD